MVGVSSSFLRGDAPLLRNPRTLRPRSFVPDPIAALARSSERGFRAGRAGFDRFRRSQLIRFSRSPRGRRTTTHSLFKTHECRQARIARIGVGMAGAVDSRRTDHSQVEADVDRPRSAGTMRTCASVPRLDRQGRGHFYDAIFFVQSPLQALGALELAAQDGYDLSASLVVVIVDRSSPASARQALATLDALGESLNLAVLKFERTRPWSLLSDSLTPVTGSVPPELRGLSCDTVVTGNLLIRLMQTCLARIDYRRCVAVDDGTMTLHTTEERRRHGVRVSLERFVARSRARARGFQHHWPPHVHFFSIFPLTTADRDTAATHRFEWLRSKLAPVDAASGSDLSEAEEGAVCVLGTVPAEALSLPTEGRYEDIINRVFDVLASPRDHRYLRPHYRWTEQRGLHESVKVVESPLPAELALPNLRPKIRTVVGFRSSALFTLACLLGDDTRVLCVEPAPGANWGYVDEWPGLHDQLTRFGIGTIEVP